MTDTAIATIRQHTVPVTPASAARRLVDAIDPSARLVLIGEATHGTREFYRIRAEVTRLLIEERGFTVVAAEADWPDAYRACQWVQHGGADETAEAALADFTRFPRWMWRNREVVRFLHWLRGFNADRAGDGQVGFFGLDLYSLHRSIAAVLAYLNRVDPVAARQARHRYSCFELFGQDAQSYGYAAASRLTPSCEDAVVMQLIDLQRHAVEYAGRDGRVAGEAYFSAEQNARVVKDAEAYYRAMFRGRADSWNLRDRHMMTTLQALIERDAGRRPPARAVVWAHNSHLGDARATALGAGGELNLGQLAREQWGTSVVSIGMTTYQGSVTAARAWDEPCELREVRPALAGSYERLFHDTGLPAFILPVTLPALRVALTPRLERAIGVLYLPETERASHYFTASLPAQFDLVLHLDETHALEPLEKWSRHEVDLPETWPTGI